MGEGIHKYPIERYWAGKILKCIQLKGNGSEGKGWRIEKSTPYVVSCLIERKASCVVNCTIRIRVHYPERVCECMIYKSKRCLNLLSSLLDCQIHSKHCGRTDQIGVPLSA